MKIIVQKFGGTSVESKEKLEIACKRIKEKLSQGYKVIVVVSAQGKTTDNLITKSKEYVNNTYPQDMDILLSTGELQTVALLSMMLREKGYLVSGLSGKQAGIITDSNHMNANIIDIMQYNILSKLEENDVIVVAGFQGTDKYGNITTLGRGGSDLSAVAIAASINAEICEIYTDVEGIYSGNPKIIENAKLLKEISYDEMLMAASSGSKVLHNRSVAIGKEYDIPIIVKNPSVKNKETIVNNNICENYSPKIIALEENLVKISLIGTGMLTNSESISTIYEIAKDLNTYIHMVSMSEICLSILVDKDISTKFANEINDRLIV